MFRSVITAAGFGRRLGQDKALVALGATTAVERVCATHRDAGVEAVTVVRRVGSAALPPLDARVVETEPPEMIDSLRAGLDTVADDDWVMFHPVDYPLVGVPVVTALREACATTRASIVLPLHDERPGHPIAFAARCVDEILDPATVSLRDVIRRDASRVDVVRVDDPWIHRDLDTPEDLAAALEYLRR